MHKRTDIVAFTAIATVIASHQLLLLVRPAAGVYAVAASLAALAILAVSSERYRSLAIAASLLPLATMVAISLPQSTAFAQSAVFYGILLLLGTMYYYLFRKYEPSPQPKIGWRTYAYGIPAMLILGQLLALTAYKMIGDDYPFEGTAAVLVGSAAVLFAIAEEVVFRGLIQRQASFLTHPASAALLATVLYAGMGISLGSWSAFLYMLFAGGLLSALYYFRRSLVLTITLNITTKLVFLGLLATYVY